MTRKGLAGLSFFGIVCVIGLSLTSTPAKADDWRIGINSHGGVSFHYNSGYRYRDGYRGYRHVRHDRHRYRGKRYGYRDYNYRYRDHRRHRKGYRSRTRYIPYVSVPSRRYSRPARRYASRDCHSVWKQGRWRGRPAKVGGLMCYNRHGESYIVRDSKYLIHYY